MEKVNWQPATKENEFVNNMWEIFDDAEGATKDTYEISFEALDCFFRNVFRWLNSDTDVQRSVATEVDSKTDDDKQKLISSNEAKEKEIERLKGLVYEISKGNINPDTGKEYFSGLSPDKFNKKF